MIMKNNKDLAPQSAAHKLAVKTLKKADNLFYRQRRAMEDTDMLKDERFRML